MADEPHKGGEPDAGSANPDEAPELPASSASELQALRQVEDIISRMKEERGELPPAERRVADEVLRDVEFAVRASNAELAQRAQVSEPTVTRFCRSIGCAGVRDFKLKLAQSLVVGTMYFRQPPGVPDGESMPPYWSSVLYHAREAIEAAQRQLELAQVRAGADLLAAARQVIVFGVGGGSTAIAQDAQYRLFRYGLSVTAYSDAHLMRMVASTLRHDDVVIAISATGRSPETLDAVRLASQYHAKIIAVTPPQSHLAALSDVLLGLSIPEIPDVLKPTASRYAFLVAIDLLAAGVAYRIGRDAQESLRRIKYNLLNFRKGDVLEPLGD